MKQRITYIRQKTDPFNLNTLQVITEKKILKINNLKAAVKEHRISLGLNELPDEVFIIGLQCFPDMIYAQNKTSFTERCLSTYQLNAVLEQSQELFIRWVSQESYHPPSSSSSTVPYVARLSPGLHVFFTPRRSRTSSACVVPNFSNLKYLHIHIYKLSIYIPYIY